MAGPRFVPPAGTSGRDFLRGLFMMVRGEETVIARGKRPERARSEDLPMARDQQPQTWSEPSLPLRLPAGEVHVWRHPAQFGAVSRERCRLLLDDAERQAAGRFVFAKDEARFTAGRAFLRTILAGYLGADPRSLQFTRGEHGKPRLREGATAADLAFNVSHAERLGLIAVSAGLEVGVDVEWLDRRAEHLALARHSFAPEEAAQLQTLTGDELVGAFFRCWTRKEAVIKAVGKGLSLPLRSFAVTLLPGWEPALVRAPDEEALSGLALFHLEPWPRYVGALAVRGACARLRLWTADDLLT